MQTLETPLALTIPGQIAPNARLRVAADGAIIINLDPCSKPRMTQSDRWKTRPATTKYWKYKDELTALWGDRQVPEQVHLLFVVKMPKSWSKSKQSQMLGTPHKGKPDADNLGKAFLDALLEDDSHIWDVRATKIWGEASLIRVQEMEAFKVEFY